MKRKADKSSFKVLTDDGKYKWKLVDANNDFWKAYLKDYVGSMRNHLKEHGVGWKVKWGGTTEGQDKNQIIEKAEKLSNNFAVIIKYFLNKSINLLQNNNKLSVDFLGKLGSFYKTNSAANNIKFQWYDFNGSPDINDILCEKLKNAYTEEGGRKNDDSSEPVDLRNVNEQFTVAVCSKVIGQCLRLQENVCEPQEWKYEILQQVTIALDTATTNITTVFNNICKLHNCVSGSLKNYDDQDENVMGMYKFLKHATRLLLQECLKKYVYTNFKTNQTQSTEVIDDDDTYVTIVNDVIKFLNQGEATVASTNGTKTGAVGEAVGADEKQVAEPEAEGEAAANDGPGATVAGEDRPTNVDTNVAKNVAGDAQQPLAQPEATVAPVDKGAAAGPAEPEAEPAEAEPAAEPEPEAAAEAEPAAEPEAAAEPEPATEPQTTPNLQAKLGDLMMQSKFVTKAEFEQFLSELPEDVKKAMSTCVIQNAAEINEKIQKNNWQNKTIKTLLTLQSESHNCEGTDTLTVLVSYKGLTSKVCVTLE